MIGENRVQELCEKYDGINRENVEIHFIGALQTNKVKYIIDKVDMIHALDRISLAKEIDRQAAKIGKVEDFLMEISKFKNIRLRGFMAIPPIMTDISTQMEYFKKIMDLYIDISTKKIDNRDISVLSIGMSSDYDLAIECGSNLVRIGTAAFGNRN